MRIPLTGAFMDERPLPADEAAALFSPPAASAPRQLRAALPARMPPMT